MTSKAPRRLARRQWIGVLVLVLAAGAGTPGLARQAQGVRAKSAAPISIELFSSLIRELSEEGGYFRADNFTSNETSYLHITREMSRLGATGGAYLGVGPEQNFSYIAKIRPQIAFIVDIRRQALIQHLMYKAIFHLAKDRTEFMCWLFSKPVPANRAQVASSIDALLEYIVSAPTDRDTFIGNLATIEKTIKETFRFPLTGDDELSLQYVYYFFWRANLRISYGPGFPSLRTLILATDLDGVRGNFLANDADYEFVRNLQEQNRVIPVVGDFAGPKAIGAIAGYLRNNGYTLSAFYVSNVEEYLYQDGLFDRFAENVAKLPVSSHTVLIRSLRPGWTGSHPANARGDDRMSLLQKVTVFLQDFKAGAYPNYWKLITTHYIAGTSSPRRAPSPAK